jgi:uncharacterized protein (DUF433 family)
VFHLFHFFWLISSRKEFASLISINPERRSGKPCIKGTRIAVVDILQWFASGRTQEEIPVDYPSLKSEPIRAALTFAADERQMN